jgi:two-component system sensor histidine kinase FlrB
MSQNSIEQARNLEQAFSAFNRMSVQLESSYRDLENKVSALNEELAAARSERLKQLAEKERLADRLERLLELLPGGVLVLDAEGRVSQTNPMAEALLEQGLSGKYWSDIMAEHFDHRLTEYGEVMLKNGKHVTLSMRPLDAEPGQIVLLMDVSDQHDLKAMLNRQDRLAVMGEMAASLAHQIRTPLTTAVLYASNIQKDNLNTTDRQRMSTKVVERLNHLEQMVNDMLRFTRGSSFVAATINLHTLLEEFRQIIEPQIELTGGSLSLPKSHDAIELQGDHEALLGVFLNLANNALQSCGENTVIKIVSSVIEGRIVIVFTDNGPGIAADIAEKIFTPFYTTRSEGTGLGLAVAQATLRAHDGEIKYLSQQGRGATFEIGLPLAGSNSMLPSGSNNMQEEFQQTRSMRS